MTDPVCGAYVEAFLRHLRRSESFGEVLVGQDLRPSSARIAAACWRAIEAAGAVAVDCGVLPTPALALEAGRRGVPAVMVTGSHIPFDRNGLKFYRAAGEITKADEAGIVAALQPARPAPAASPVEAGRGVGERYVLRYTAFLGPERLAGLRVGVHQHSAAGRDLLTDAVRRLGATAIELGRTDDFVPVDTEAIAPVEAGRIRGWVAEHRLDALVSTDGDGDRPLIADETGNVLRGDAVGILAARLLGADAVAAPLNVSTALERSGWFARVRRTRIGSPFVIEGIAWMQAEGAKVPVGFEANGGFILGGAVEAPGGRQLAELPTRDAMAPILALLAAAADRGVSLSSLAAALPPRATASDRLEAVPEHLSAPLLRSLATDARARAEFLAGLGGEVAFVDTLDGVRMTLAAGDIVHLRMSGNAPELRCYCESGSEKRAAWLVAAVLERAARRLGT
jgi:phosphomannomutase